MSKGIVHHNHFIPRRLEIHGDEDHPYVIWGDEKIAVRRVENTMHWRLMSKPTMRSRIQASER